MGHTPKSQHHSVFIKNIDFESHDKPIVLVIHMEFLPVVHNGEFQQLKSAI